MDGIGCDFYGECLAILEEPPEFIRPPPSFLCDGSFDEQFTCANEIPFPFQINTDRIGEEPTLAVALVCAVLISVIATVSGVLFWRNRQRFRRYFRCFGSSADSTRKSTPSAASTSEESDGTGYSTDNIDYRKKTLLSSISPQSGLNGLRYVPQHVHHLTLENHGHIYEEIPNNYGSAYYCHPGPAHRVQARYTLSRHMDAAAAQMTFANPHHQNIFQQRQSAWMDLLQRPPCAEMGANLYGEAGKAHGCPNCYYPSLPRDSSRVNGVMGRHVVNVVANPVAGLTCSSRNTANRRTRTVNRSSPYQFPTYYDNGCVSGHQLLTNSCRNEFPLVHNDLHGVSCVDERTQQTLDQSTQRRKHHRRQKFTNQAPLDGSAGVMLTRSVAMAMTGGDGDSTAPQTPVSEEAPFSHVL